LLLQAMQNQAMEKAAGSKTPRALATGLEAVAGRMSPEKAAEVPELLAQALEKTAGSKTPRALVMGLEAVAGRMSPEKAAEVAELLAQALQKAANPSQLDILAQGFVAVAKNLNQQYVTQQLITLLKHPLCVGTCRRVLVDLFNDKIATNEKFDGNVWK